MPPGGPVWSSASAVSGSSGDAPMATASRAAARAPSVSAAVRSCSARELLERGYDAGYLSLPDLLLQQDRLLQTRAAAIDAWRDLREAEADVLEAAGVLEP